MRLIDERQGLSITEIVAMLIAILFGMVFFKDPQGPTKGLQ